jgi:arylsulfatase A-like enzyme
MYGDFTTMVDAMIGRVLKQLEASGMSEETLVIFSSDNGPVWYEEDVERFAHDSSGGFRGMKGDAWEAGHRMPLVARWPGRVAAGSKSDATICFTDLMQTFAAIVRRTLPEDAGPDSFSFLPVLLGEQPVDQPVREQLVVRSANRMMTIREGAWKLIDGLGSGGFSKPGRIEPAAGDPAGQLYNLADDPGETTNLYAERPQVVARLRARLQEIEQAGRSRP